MNNPEKSEGYLQKTRLYENNQTAKINENFIWIKKMISFYTDWVQR